MRATFTRPLFPAVMSTEERTVEAMGTTAHLLITDGPAGLADRAVERLEQLEARWSRFRADSEICQLNARPGVPVMVSSDTFHLIERALDGWRLTEGRFDPTLLPQLRDAGYDRSFEFVGVNGAPRAAPSGTADAAPGTLPMPRRLDEQIHLDTIVGAVRLAPGIEIDPGGIGKGLAADLVVELLRSEGARGALVSIGGDLRCDGVAPEGAGWVVRVADPRGDDTSVGTVVLDAGAVASTWRTKRAWIAPDGTPRHHLIDPTTGVPAKTGLSGVTMIAGRGWHAEVLAKAAFLAGPVDGAAFLADHGVAGLLIADDGTVIHAGPVDRFLV